MARQPIKRSKYIMALSKDHHLGLLFCWKIREGLKLGVDLSRIKKYVSFFWKQHLKEHFLEEESLLFDELNDPLTDQAKTEHLMLTRWINTINHPEPAKNSDYILFTELLNKHIRFEERVLFPHLEASLPLATLSSACVYLEQQHQAPFKDDYPDEFWANKKQKD